MKHFFVINPHSFKRINNLKRVLIDVENSFPAERRADYKIYISRYPRDAIAAVYHYIEGCPANEPVRVYAVGGDGTLFDCLNGMVDFENAELTSVPYGNANDFVRNFGDGAREAFRDIRALTEAPARRVDVMRCGASYAVGCVTLGTEAQAVLNAEAVLKSKTFRVPHGLVPTAYVVGGLWALAASDVAGQRYSVSLDGQDYSGRYGTINISNGRYSGGGMVMNPHARVDSGELAALFTAETSPVKLAGMLRGYVNGRYERLNASWHREVFVCRPFRKMRIRSDTPMRVGLDGEFFHTREMTVELLPGAVKFFAPEGLTRNGTGGNDDN